MVLILSIGLFMVPVLRKASRDSILRQASTMLGTIGSAEWDFRANDRDHNRVQDFWTGDVSGLYYVKPMDGGPELRLIDLGVANADAKSVFLLPESSGPREGYRYQALDRDDTIEGEKGIYRVDTDKSGRKVHNLLKFGFTVFPANDRIGDHAFFTNEGNTIFRTRSTKPLTTWPSDEQLKRLTYDEED